MAASAPNSNPYPTEWGAAVARALLVNGLAVHHVSCAFLLKAMVSSWQRTHFHVWSQRMKLYYMPMACSLAPHIVANEAGIEIDLVRVDGKTKTTDAGQDFLAINPNGYVPTLILDDGQTLTEAQLVVQYLADQKPESGLMPPAGEMARYRVQQWLAFISSELHKSFGAFFKPGSTEEAKTATREHLAKRLAYVDGELAGKSYLMGQTFTVADAYLWTILGWTKFANIDLSAHANVQKFIATVAARPAVTKTLQAEGIA
jgi:glutathione S-transferase